MFYYKEYNNFFIDIHINEKTKFYNYKYLNSLKSIYLLIKYISIKYSIMPIMYDNLALVKNKLFFYSYLQHYLVFNSLTVNNDTYFLYINNTLIYKYNVFYNVLMGYLHNEFNTSLYVELNKKNNNVYNSCQLNFSKLLNIHTHFSYKELKSLNSLISFIFQTNTSNYYLNKLFYSHTLFNI